MTKWGKIKKTGNGRWGQERRAGNKERRNRQSKLTPRPFILTNKKQWRTRAGGQKMKKNKAEENGRRKKDDYPFSREEKETV